jgi:hypothetical protein
MRGCWFAYQPLNQQRVLDALPATSTGKILKHKLAESLQGIASRVEPAIADGHS